MALTLIGDGYRRFNDRIGRQIKYAGSAAFMEEAKAVIVEGNRDDRLRGVDRYGKPLAALRSKRSGPYKGKTGPPLAPSLERSRVIKNFVAEEVRIDGRRAIAAGWNNVNSAQGRNARGQFTSGKPFLEFHILGAGHNPVRDIAGISPKTWSKLRKLFSDWAAGLFRKRGR